MNRDILRNVGWAADAEKFNLLFTALAVHVVTEELWLGSIMIMHLRQAPPRGLSDPFHLSALNPKGAIQEIADHYIENPRIAVRPYDVMITDGQVMEAMQALKLARITKVRPHP